MDMYFDKLTTHNIRIKHPKNSNNRSVNPMPFFLYALFFVKNPITKGDIINIAKQDAVNINEINKWLFDMSLCFSNNDRQTNDEIR